MIESLNIPKTEDTPSVSLNAETGEMLFGDTSWPEDALSFYEPIISWLHSYFADPRPRTNFTFNFSYLNTASSKQLAKVMMLIKGNTGNTDIHIKWTYEREDLEMQKMGEKFSGILGMEFDFEGTDAQPIDDEFDVPEGHYNYFRP